MNVIILLASAIQISIMNKEFKDGTFLFLFLPLKQNSVQSIYANDLNSSWKNAETC